jgi:AcrR family transcriptional regulator
MGLFARRGFAGVTSREIAAAAGVSEALVFKHFPDLPSLYDAILAHRLREPAPMETLQARAGGLSDEEYLAGIARIVLERVDADDTFLRLLLRSALDGHALARDFRRARIEPVRAEIERLVRRRAMRLGRRGGVEPHLAAQLFSGLITAALLERHVFREPQVRKLSAARLAASLARLFVHGVGAREGQR